MVAIEEIKLPIRKLEKLLDHKSIKVPGNLITQLGVYQFFHV